MIEDIYEPLACFRDKFQPEFIARIQNLFKVLTAQSKVNIAANRKLAGKVEILEAKERNFSLKEYLLHLVHLFSTVFAVLAFLYLLCSLFKFGVKPFSITTVVCGILSVCSKYFHDKIERELSQVRGEIKTLKEAGWKQMEALNRLFSRDMTTKMFEKTVPRIHFDDYVTFARLRSLYEDFDWNDNFNENKSIIFAQSGEINGNPFIIAEYMKKEWGWKVYTGSKTIYWTEWETDSEGRRRRVERSETLYASIEKPYPYFTTHKVLIYGNDAAPNLHFSHEPSGLSAKNTLGNKIKKRLRLSRLKAFSRNLDDDSNFTLMSNHEFETWFHAKDRDNEVEFRLLFTPIAQIQMLQLMKDETVGFGDDFIFEKRGKINILTSQHLDKTEIDTSPSAYRSWSFDKIYRSFIKFNLDYFRGIYFAFAPLLAIPIYQQTRKYEEMFSKFRTKKSSFWEHEVIANAYGESEFEHPECVTHSLLKTRIISERNGETRVAVSAYGYRGEDRVDYERVHGGDGNTHSVAIEWVEYFPVKGVGSIHLTEKDTLSDSFYEKYMSATDAMHQHKITSFIE